MGRCAFRRRTNPAGWKRPLGVPSPGCRNGCRRTHASCDIEALRTGRTEAGPLEGGAPVPRFHHVLGHRSRAFGLNVSGLPVRYVRWEQDEPRGQDTRHWPEMEAFFAPDPKAVAAWSRRTMCK